MKSDVRKHPGAITEAPTHRNDRLYATATRGWDDRWHLGNRQNVNLKDEPLLIVYAEHDSYGAVLVLSTTMMGWMMR